MAGASVAGANRMEVSLPRLLKTSAAFHSLRSICRGTRTVGPFSEDFISASPTERSFPFRSSIPRHPCPNRQGGSTTASEGAKRSAMASVSPLRRSAPTSLPHWSIDSGVAGGPGGGRLAGESGRVAGCGSGTGAGCGGVWLAAPGDGAACGMARSAAARAATTVFMWILRNQESRASPAGRQASRRHDPWRGGPGSG